MYRRAGGDPSVRRLAPASSPFRGAKILKTEHTYSLFSRDGVNKCIAGRVGTPQALASSRQLPFQGRQEIKAKHAISHAGFAGERATRAIKKMPAAGAPLKAHTARRTAHSHSTNEAEKPSTPIPHFRKRSRVHARDDSEKEPCATQGAKGADYNLMPSAGTGLSRHLFPVTCQSRHK